MTNPQKNNPPIRDHFCSYKYAFMLDNAFRRLFQDPKKIVGEYIREGHTVIDLGCGPGFFTIEMAKMVGPKGKVIAVDFQPEMLNYVKRKALKKNVADRIEYHKCGKDRLGLDLKEAADFMLAYYMVHETPDPGAFLQEAGSLLKKGGKFLVVEPRMHVGREEYEEMTGKAGKVGFVVVGYPQKKGGRSALFTI